MGKRSPDGNLLLCKKIGKKAKDRHKEKAPGY